MAGVRFSEVYNALEGVVRNPSLPHERRTAALRELAAAATSADPAVVDSASRAALGRLLGYVAENRWCFDDGALEGLRAAAAHVGGGGLGAAALAERNLGPQARSSSAVKAPSNNGAGSAAAPSPDTTDDDWAACRGSMYL
jgi:hypothetical protein